MRPARPVGYVARPMRGDPVPGARLHVKIVYWPGYEQVNYIVLTHTVNGEQRQQSAAISSTAAMLLVLGGMHCEQEHGEMNPR